MIHGERKSIFKERKFLVKTTLKTFYGNCGSVNRKVVNSKQFELRKQISELETMYNDITKQIETLNNERPTFELINGETYTFKDYQNYLVLDKEYTIKIEKLYNIRHDITMQLFDLKINIVD